jgi:hypothetical protein
MVSLAPIGRDHQVVKAGGVCLASGAHARMADKRLCNQEAPMWSEPPNDGPFDVGRLRIRPRARAAIAAVSVWAAAQLSAIEVPLPSCTRFWRGTRLTTRAHQEKDKRSPMSRLALAVLLSSLVTALAGVPSTSSAAQAHQGLQAGWAIDDAGHVNFVHSVISELPFMQQAGAGVVRINFRLGACFPSWTSAGCSTADQPTGLADYDQVVNTAINTYHLQVVGLLSNETWNGTQTQWTANNAENTGGTGDNSYIQAFATNAAGVLAQHFSGRINTWEVWNEPNAWTSNPSAGVYTGGSFIYPSNFAWLLKRSYTAIKRYQPGKASTVISGGLFGHDPSGAAMLVSEPNGSSRIVVKHGTTNSGVVNPASTVSCTSAEPSGADYLCNTYSIGRKKASWRAGAYPLDRIGQHVYIDQGGLTSASKLTGYLQDVRSAYLAFEGASTTKQTEITEFGWVANPGSSTYPADAANQSQNVQTAYNTFRTTSYVARADYFAAQDVPEGSIFYGLVEGDGTTYKPAFSTYQTAAGY